jgi:hypothetical protein
MARGAAGEERVFMLSADGDRVRGTRWDGWYEGTVLLQKFEPRGSWTVESIYLADNAGHSRLPSRQDVTERGFVTVLELA